MSISRKRNTGRAEFRIPYCAGLAHHASRLNAKRHTVQAPTKALQAHVPRESIARNTEGRYRLWELCDSAPLPSRKGREPIPSPLKCVFRGRNLRSKCLAR